MDALLPINFLLAAIFFICYAYQFIYIPVPWLKKPHEHAVEHRHRFAVLICARNEERVIAKLIERASTPKPTTGAAFAFS